MQPSIKNVLILALAALNIPGISAREVDCEELLNSLNAEKLKILATRNFIARLEEELKEAREWDYNGSTCGTTDGSEHLELEARNSQMCHVKLNHPQQISDEKAKIGMIAQTIRNLNRQIRMNNCPRDKHPLDLNNFGAPKFEPIFNIDKVLIRASIVRFGYPLDKYRVQRYLLKENQPYHLMYISPDWTAEEIAAKIAIFEKQIQAIIAEEKKSTKMFTMPEIPSQTDRAQGSIDNAIENIEGVEEKIIKLYELIDIHQNKINEDQAEIKKCEKEIAKFNLEVLEAAYALSSIHCEADFVEYIKDKLRLETKLAKAKLENRSKCSIAGIENELIGYMWKYLEKAHQKVRNHLPSNIEDYAAKKDRKLRLQTTIAELTDDLNDHLAFIYQANKTIDSLEMENEKN